MKYSITGYRNNSKDRFNSSNVIPSNRISMSNVDFPVYGMSNTGDNRLMYPGEEHKFDGDIVTEIPIKTNNMAKSKGYSAPGFKYGGNKLGGLAIIPDNNPWSASSEPVPVDYMRATNGMMQMGGSYLDYMGLNPALSGMQYGGGTRNYNNGYTDQDNNHINYIDDKTGYHNMQTPGQHYTNDGFKKSTGSTNNGASFSKFGGSKFQNFMPAPLEYAYLQYGGMSDNDEDVDKMQMGGDTDIPEFAKGGIHIKPSHVGRFTAYKARTGKTTEQALHSKDPAVRKMANFARNAAKWKHEYGGNVQSNLSKFIKMQDGGKVDVNGNPIGAWGSNPNVNTANTPQTITDVNSGYNDAKSDTALANDPVAQQQMKPQSGLAPVSPQYATNDQPIDIATDNGQYTQQPNQPQGPNGAQRAGAWGTFGSNTLLGLAAAGNAYGYQQGLKNGAQWNRQHGATDTAFAAQKLNTAGNHGNYNQQGHFRPDANTPYNPGIMYPTAQMGGYQGPYTGSVPQSQAIDDIACYQMGGEFDMPDEHVQKLRRLGYKVDYI